MTEEERRIITDYVTRVSGAEAQAARPASPWGGSVPSTRAPANLPSVDPEADRLIQDLFARYPEARYRITQTAFVQEAALVQAQNRIQQLEWELDNTRRQAAAAQAQGGNRGGLFGGMFGGGQRPPVPAPMSPPPQPMTMPNGYAPQQMLQPGRGGSGFLGTALTTAAGVAGGMVLGNALMGMFSGHEAHAAAASAVDDATGGAFGQDAVATPASSPWTDPGGQNDAYGAQDTGWGQNDAAASQDSGWGQDDATGYDTDDSGSYDDEV
ncbi:hypothetical protein RGI145_11790 [Roseomonas gilardii]|uniref:ABC transporter substrate-binding protein n=1 Tax=Roseomonas gilardii TaxID=257708 RepID=A0A1L7AFY8_9PROT|nr:DUF2076 domain-containing protein [Roseomonas gilardii]APT57683.1 hypothetical protein RGI145_11790 [Roseomonas gilardii]